jgi:hypothetical protein
VRRSSVTTRVSQGQVLAAMSDWEDASPITKEDLAALTNEELAAVAAMNNFLSQMLGGRSAELHYMGQYEFASHSKTVCSAVRRLFSSRQGHGKGSRTV